MTRQARKLLVVVNLPRKVCNHLIGEDHHIAHRLTVGVFIMAVGVSIAQIHVAIIVIDMLAEGVGYVVHGIGCIPVIDLIMKLKDEQNVTTSESDETRERGRATGVDSTARNRSRAREDALSED